MYQLIKNIDDYSQFLPWCSASRVIEVYSNASGYEQAIARIDIKKGLISSYFISENTYISNKRIDMKLVEGPFEFLSGYWQFISKESYTIVEFHLEYRFSNSFLAKLYAASFNIIIDKIIAAFLDRADTIYG